MESKKSQGPSRAVLIASAIIICVALLSAAYFMRDEASRSKSQRTAPATSTLEPLFARCDSEPKVEMVDGLSRTTCTARTHPAFMIFADADGDAIRKAGLMVPLRGSTGELAERTAVGFELFSLMAGEPAESFLPAELIADVGVRETHFERDGLLYVTQPMAEVGVVFSVLPPSDSVYSPVP